MLLGTTALTLGLTERYSLLLKIIVSLTQEDFQVRQTFIYNSELFLFITE